MSVTFYAKNLELNVTDRNAVELLRLLGFDQVVLSTAEGWSIDPTQLLIQPQELIDACDLALAAISSIPELDCAKPGMESRGANGARVIECGRREGYLKDRITKLREIAQEAKDNNTIVSAC